jgi:hypothetical protein
MSIFTALNPLGHHYGLQSRKTYEIAYMVQPYYLSYIGDLYVQ